MTFNIRKSSTYDSNPGSLRLRKDGLGGNLFLRGKFPGEDVFPPYTPELVTNGLIYHVEFKDTEYSSGTFPNKVDPSQGIITSEYDSIQDGLLYQNYLAPSQDQAPGALRFSSFPPLFPTGNDPVTISLCFIPTYINSDPDNNDTFIFQTQGLKDVSRNGELLIRLLNATSITAKCCITPSGEVELVSPVALQVGSKYYVTFQHEGTHTTLSVKKDSESVDIVTALDPSWNVLKSDPPDETPIYVGGKRDTTWSSVSGPNFTGYLGAILVYNRSLTQQEIALNNTYLSGLFANVGP